jgi:hypothetical protein
MSKRTPGGANLHERKAAKDRYLAQRARHRQRLANKFGVLENTEQEEN